MILAIDTSGQNLGLALVKDDRAAFSILLKPGLKHGEILQNSVAEFLEKSDATLGDLRAIAVTLGPGSFTGLRIGLAAVKGYSYALNIPITGLSALEAGAHAIKNTSQPVVVFFDAKRDEIYWAAFDCSGDFPIRISPDTVGPLNDLKELAENRAILFGPASMQDQSQKLFGTVDYRSNDDYNLAIPTALRGQIDIGRNLTLERAELVPIYLRY
jgi:tRNA threonylcarbamoyladenosine biosynthesis protein TsaB